MTSRSGAASSRRTPGTRGGKGCPSVARGLNRRRPDQPPADAISSRQAVSHPDVAPRAAPFAQPLGTSSGPLRVLARGPAASLRDESLVGRIHDQLAVLVHDLAVPREDDQGFRLDGVEVRLVATQLDGAGGGPDVRGVDAADGGEREAEW